MFLSKIKTAASFAMTIGLLAAGAGVAVSHGYAEEALQKKGEASEKRPGADQKHEQKDLNDKPLPEGVLARMALGESGHGQYVHAIAVSPDGKLIASGALHLPILRLWDVATGKPLRKLQVTHEGVNTCAFAADGKIVLAGARNGTVEMWDAATGKSLHRFVFESPPNVRGGMMSVDQVHLSPDGRRLTAFCYSPSFHPRFRETTTTLRVWDTATEKLLTDRPFRVDEHHKSNPDGSGHSMWVAHSRFTRDGNGVTVRINGGLTIEDTATGREGVTIAGNLGRPLTFSRDGRLAAVSEYKPFDDPFNGYEVRAVVLAEALTGKEVMRLDTGRVRHLEFSPDGSFLATADADSIRLWDIATGQPVFHRAWPKEIRKWPDVCPALSFAYALDGRAVVTGLYDGTLLVWDLATEKRAAAQGAKAVDRKQLDQLWADLAGDDAKKAYRAARSLAIPQAVPYLKERLRPVRLVDSKRVEKLIADLDNEQFTVRDAATKELAKLADLAEPLLLRARETNQSVEAKRRIGRILASPTLPPSGERLRTLRAIGALERIETPDARDVLRQLTTGVESAWETREAKQSLDWLEHTKAN